MMAPDDPRHGTVAGYTAHRRDVDDRKPCDRCREAHRVQQAAYYRSRRNPATPIRPRVNVEARNEDILWMAETGESATGVAERLGITRDALDQWCRRQGLDDTLRTLAARDPHDPIHRGNQWTAA